MENNNPSKQELELSGRLLSDYNIDLSLMENKMITKKPAITIHKTYINCTRCGANCEKDEARINQNIYYCYNCVNLGRLDSTMQLVNLPEINHFSTKKMF